jgi:hypothetical protein
MVGMAWLSRVGVDTPYLTGVALPMIVLGLGAGTAITPLTAAGVSGVAAEDAGAASGLVNVAHQLGGSLGVGILITVFAAATPHTVDAASLAHGVSAVLTGGAVMLGLALLVALGVVRRRPAPAPVIDLEEALAEERLAA